MSRQFYLAVTLIVATFAAYETTLNVLNRINDKKIAELCTKPAVSGPSVRYSAVFWIPPKVSK